MVWKELTAHLEVVWAALTALAIVLVLTPAVGSAARHLRIVPRPSEGDRDRSSVPRLGGLALFLGILVPALAFLHLDGEMRGNGCTSSGVSMSTSSVGRSFVAS